MTKPKKPIAQRVKNVMKIGEYRTVTSLMKGLRASRVDIEDCIHDIDGLDLIVGDGIQGLGTASRNRMDWEIERYD